MFFKTYKSLLVLVASLIIIPLVILSYFVLEYLLLQFYSLKFKQLYISRNLENKKVEEVVQTLGRPDNVKCVVAFQHSYNFQNFETHKPYCYLTYLTDNILINEIFWVPFGGTKIFIDTAGRVTGFKETLY